MFDKSPRVVTEKCCLQWEAIFLLSDFPYPDCPKAS